MFIFISRDYAKGVIRMKRVKKIFLGTLLTVAMLVLQGCSFSELTTPVTSHNVTENESNAYAFHVELNADLSQGYKWYMYTTGDIDESDSKVHKGFFNNTYNTKYKYVIREDGEFDFYLILVKDGNLETARIYPYEISVTQKDGFTCEEMSDYNLNTDTKLMKTLSETLEITTDE